MQRGPGLARCMSLAALCLDAEGQAFHISVCRLLWTAPFIRAGPCPQLVLVSQARDLWVALPGVRLS